MRTLALATILAALAAGHGARAQAASTRLDDPKVEGRAIDHCADIDAVNDCTARGEAKAAMKACVQNGFAEQQAAHWNAASGSAMHYITEYDMHAGEVGGRWVEQPTNGTFDWIVCKK